MKTIDQRASTISRCLRSTTRASTKTSGMEASEEPPVNVPATPGIRAQMRQKPPVSASAKVPERRNSLLEYSFLRTLSRVRKPRAGKVNWRMTRAIETVLNLLYIGMWSKNSLVNHMKWFPTARNTARIVAASSHHFSFPL